MIGYLTNLAVTRLGEVTRCAVMSRYEKIPINQVIGTVIIERVVDVITIFLLLFLTIVLEFNRMSALSTQYIFNPLAQKLEMILSKGGVFYLVAVLVIIAVVFALWLAFLLLRKTKYYLQIKTLLRDFVAGIKTIGRLHNRNLFLFYTFLIWLLYFLMSYVCFYSFASTMNLGPVAGLAVMVFGGFGFVAPVPGGIGAFEFMVTMVLTAYGIGENDRNSFALLVHAAQTIAVLAFGLMSFIFIPIINKRSPV